MVCYIYIYIYIQIYTYIYMLYVEDELVIMMLLKMSIIFNVLIMCENPFPFQISNQVRNHVEQKHFSPNSQLLTLSDVTVDQEVFLCNAARERRQIVGKAFTCALANERNAVGSIGDGLEMTFDVIFKVLISRGASLISFLRHNYKNALIFIGNECILYQRFLYLQRILSIIMHLYVHTITLATC